MIQLITRQRDYALFSHIERLVLYLTEGLKENDPFAIRCLVVSYNALKRMNSAPSEAKLKVLDKLITSCSGDELNHAFDLLNFYETRIQMSSIDGAHKLEFCIKFRDFISRIEEHGIAKLFPNLC